MNEQNKAFLNRSEFLVNSNITDPLLDNLFRLEFIDDDGNQTLSDYIEYVDEDNNTILPDKYIDVWDLLIKNAHSITVSSQETEYSPQYIRDDRRYTAFKRLDSNIQISFIESADLSIRKVIDRWLDLTLPTNKEGLYFDETSVDLNILSIDSNMDTKAKMIYEGIQPISYADITLNLGGDVEVKAIVVIFNFVSNRME